MSFLLSSCRSTSPFFVNSLHLPHLLLCPPCCLLYYEETLVLDQMTTDRFTFWAKVFFRVVAAPQSNEVGLYEVNFVNKVLE